jgi:hypothetical protein
MRSRAAALFLAWVTVTPAPAAVVGRIDVVGNERTHASVIQRELLLAPGDSLAPNRLAESERNLRALPFLGDVHVQVQPAGTDTVTLVVTVQDLYARALSPLVEGDLDELSWGGVAVDYNLLGRGRTARLTAFDDARRGRRLTGRYEDPRWRDSRLRLGLVGGWADEGHTLSVRVEQPFYSLAATHAFGLSLASEAARTRLYRAGALTALYEDREESANLWWSRSTGDAVKLRPGLALTVSERRFAARAPFIYAPDDRRRVRPSASLTVWRPRYVTERYLRYLGPEEDWQVGSWARAGVGASPRWLGSDREYLFGSLTLAPQHRLAPGWYLFASIDGSGRWRSGRVENLWLRAATRLYGRRSLAGRPVVLALRFDVDRLHRPEDGGQLLLGGDAGLRGQPVRRFDGSRRLLASAEVRPLLVRRRDWALGGALFADAGGAWSQQPEMAGGLGVGLRLGLPRVYDTPLLRADVARGVRGGGWQLSVGLGQPF